MLLPRGQANRDRSSFLRETITFDEFIADVNGSINFVATQFPLNPGISKTFPKGSVKAALYSEWKQTKCEFYYKPEVTGFSSQGQTGKVILAMDYNAGNPAPTTKQQVEIMHRVDDMPCEPLLLATDSMSVNRSDAKYIRTGPIPVDEDIKTFDGGNLWVCTVGQIGNTGPIGEVHVRYTFVCSKPTLLNPAQGGLIPVTTVSQFHSTAPEASGATGVAKTLLLATADVNGIGAVNTAGSIVLPAGYYIIWCQNEAENDSSLMQGSTLLFEVNSAAVVSSNQEGSAANSEVNLSNSTNWFVTSTGTTAVSLVVSNTFFWWD